MIFSNATLSMVVLSLLTLTNLAQAGVKEAGGGDICEDRIKLIRDDIDSWISNNGPANLKLPTGITLNDYSHRMVVQIQKAKIQCVSQGDADFPVEVDGSAKTCKFSRTFWKSQITCDYAKLQAMSESDQYVLIHHEYAGLAKIESPDGGSSNYDVSNQISDFLTGHTVKKLSVKKKGNAVNCMGIMAIPDSFSYVCDGPYASTPSGILLFRSDDDLDRVCSAVGIDTGIGGAGSAPKSEKFGQTSIFGKIEPSWIVGIYILTKDYREDTVDAINNDTSVLTKVTCQSRNPYVQIP